jgi:hypothetical protein
LSRKARKIDGSYELYATEEFPYIDLIGEMCSKYKLTELSEFYRKIWAPRKRKDKHNKPFFNFCKIVVNKADENSRKEIYAAEALVRYIAEMFYALVFSSCLIFITFLTRYFYLQSVNLSLLIILIAYLLAIAGILANFRYIRIKEVLDVFEATYLNRKEFLQQLKEVTDDVKGE